MTPKLRPFAAVLLDGNPKTWERAQSHGSRRFTSSEVTSAKEAWQWATMTQMDGEATDSPLSVAFVFVMPDRRRCDIDNLAKLPMDALNGIVWKDDSQIVQLVVTKQVVGSGVRADGPCSTMIVWRVEADPEGVWRKLDR